MEDSVRNDVRAVLEETNDAFEQYGPMNSDYAAFASMSLREFQSALGRPELTGRELRQLLRRGQGQHKAQNAETSWSTFMARYVQSKANNNRQG